MNLLSEVRKIARLAKKSGSKWVGKNGNIKCKDGRCTLAAIMYKNSEPLRKIQEEFEALMARAEEHQNGVQLAIDPQVEVFEGLPEDDPSPDPYTAARALGVNENLAELVVEANDNSLRFLKSSLESAKENARSYGYTPSEDEEVQRYKRLIRAREILEEVLFA